MKKNVVKLMLAVFLTCISLPGFTRDPFDEDDEVIANGGPTDPGGHPEDVPLDPGSWILLAAGVGYGIKKWRDAKQNAGENIDEKTIRF